MKSISLECKPRCASAPFLPAVGVECVCVEIPFEAAAWDEFGGGVYFWQVK